MYNKKGILMTLGLVFVSLTLLAFANVIVNHSETSEERIKEFGESERLYNLDNSVSRTLSRMVMRGMNGTHDVSVEGNLIRLKTQFANETQPYEKDILDQFEIFKNRTESSQSLNFSLRRPFLGKNDFPVSIEGQTGGSNLQVKNSSRFYLLNNLGMYVDLTTWPENMIYLNGFNETNTESINITIWSQDLKLYMAEEVQTNVIPPCLDCLNITVNNYYQSDPLDQKEFGIKTTNFIMGVGEYYKGLFEVKMIRDSIWADNVTLTGNWINSSRSSSSVEEDYWSETTAGLALTLPDLGCTSAGNAFNLLYFGLNDQATCLERNVEITVEIKLRDDSEAAQHEIYLVSPPSYGIGPPLLDTIGGGVRLKYLN